LWRPGTPKRRRYASCDPDRDREQWAKAGELCVGDRVVVALDWLTDECSGLSTEDAWILGAFCGDGSGRGRFCSADQEIIERLSHSYGITQCAGNNGYDYYVRGAQDFLRRHGMYASNARSKRIPPAVFTSGRAAVTAFLAGYLDTDGWVSYRPCDGNKTRIEIAWGSVNRDLLVQCQHLLAALGVNAAVCRSAGTYKGDRHESWNLGVRDGQQARMLASMLAPHMACVRKRDAITRVASHESYFTFGQRDTDRVRSVEVLPDAVSIAVEVEDIHTHITSGIVTHNTEFAAWILFCELHPDAPVRFDGFDGDGRLKQGRPVRSPFIPMMAVTERQVEDLAFAVLKMIVEECPDSDRFVATDERIIRIGPTGRAAGEAMAVSNAPGARDGARTTCQHFDEPHRLFMARMRAAHETMLQNTPKRPMEDPWTFYTSTAGKPGLNSIQEDLRKEAEDIDAGLVEDPSVFFFSRWAGPEHDDLSTVDKRIAAVADATGPIGEWGVGQFERIAKDYDRKGVDRSYWEQVWLNRWRRGSAQMFDMLKVDQLFVNDPIPDGAFVAAGFDGAKFRDATALVITDIETGWQQLLGLWERPDDVEFWEVPFHEVDQAVSDMFERFDVWRLSCDPPFWTAEVAGWAQRYPDQVVEWFTVRKRPMADACRAYAEATDFVDDPTTADIRFAANPWRDDLVRHLSNVDKRQLTLVDEQGQPLWVMQKQDGRQDDKIDAAMAGCLSWDTRLEAVRSGARPRAKAFMPWRIY
jgi:hypothetical protein